MLRQGRILHFAGQWPEDAGRRFVLFQLVPRQSALESRACGELSFRGELDQFITARDDVRPFLLAKQRFDQPGQTAFLGCRIRGLAHAPEKRLLGVAGAVER